MATWVLVADQAKAKILSSKDNGRLTQLLTTFVYEDAEHKTSEFKDDRPGRGYQTGSNRHAYSSGTKNIEEQLSEQFARKIVNYLENKRATNAFNELIVIAAPKFLGDLRRIMPPPLEKIIRGELNKVLTDLPEDEIGEYLRAM